jgi:hypothetical protein
MSALPQVSPDWLLLRADVDDRSRSAELAQAAAALLPAGRQVVHDLGSGSGAMMRWLAPLLRGPQRWVLHDADAGILEHRDPRPTVDASGLPVVCRTSVEELEDLHASTLAGATLVVASALLDVITADEARTIVDACVEIGAPVLFSLTVAGRIELDPPDQADPLFTNAFNAHQRRDADGRSLLGPDAVEVVARLFVAAGWQVRTAGTPWELTPADGALTAEWLDGWLAAAVEQQPELGGLAGEYRARRLGQLAAGELRVVVHHEDVLAWLA